MWIFALFLVVPLIEIALFITVGGWLTLWPTLAIVVLTGVLGAFLVRWQGMGVLRALQQANVTKDPFSPMLHGALILIGGFMLMLPGFFTDSIGFLLMIPPLRTVIIRVLARRIKAGALNRRSFATQRTRPGAADDWVDAEFEEVAPDRDTPDGPSKWTRH